MKIMPFYRVVIFLLSTLFLTACVYTPTTGDGSKTFNVEYLRVWSDDYIIPSIDNLLTSSQALLSASEKLQNADTEGEKTIAIEDCKSAYIKAVSDLERFIIYDDNSDRLSDKVNSFPVKSAILNKYLSSPKDLENDIKYSSLNNNNGGLPAIEYVLYSDESIKTTDANAVFIAKAKVLHIIAQRIEELVKARKKKIEDNRERFIMDNSSSSSSSVSIFLNNLISNIEYIRNSKLGYPMGIYGWGKHPHNPSSAEAIYIKNGYSITFLKYSLESLYSLYYGLASKDKHGLKDFIDDYLVNRPGYRKDATIKELTDAIDKTIKDLKNTNGNISEMVEVDSDYIKLETIYRDIQSIVFSLKTPVLGGLGIAITYSDGEEGD